MVETVTRRTLRIRRLVRRSVVLTAAEPVPLAPCAACGRDVVAVTPGEAGLLLQTGHEALEGLVDSGRIHAIPTASGSSLICRDSIFRRVP